ncbi:hypothetical protein IEQ34_017112 [Dendrobium chrysotoxum]|uniref:Uncharacterized protein n=1 Tax=Dendrobium chrysotoxum TaxID=161865 RepID=A0AAV7GAR8_DENCH|nr:hypothetical protein IEQ34_017112 [Dendrobium chrysotoxum]
MIVLLGFISLLFVVAFIVSSLAHSLACIKGWLDVHLLKDWQKVMDLAQKKQTTFYDKSQVLRLKWLVCIEVISQK